MKKLLALAIALALATTMALARSPKVASDLPDRQGNGTVDVIVQFTVEPTATQHDKVRAKGGQLKRQLGLIKGGLYSLPAQALDALAADPEVAFISPDREVQAMLDYSNATVAADLAGGQGFVTPRPTPSRL